MPFEPDQEDAYRRWREAKLRDYPASAADLLVEVRDPARLSDGEFRALRARIAKANMAIYAAPPDCAITKDVVHAFDARFGLHQPDRNLKADADGISAIRVRAGETSKGARYIPYTDRPINWHTDGYYNPPARTIRAMTLHCAAAAATGGENALFDPEVAYILLRDQNPAWVAALAHPRAMTIPANTEEPDFVRPEQAGPVFSFGFDRALHMRFTARTRSIQWRDDAATREAVAFLIDALNGDSPQVFRHRLAPGQGLISNNVLHNRTAFADDPAASTARLIFRGRYPDRIRTDTKDTEP